MCDKINFVVQIGWNRVNQILAPCVGEFCFNPLRRPSDTSPKSDEPQSYLGEGKVGVERRSR